MFNSTFNFLGPTCASRWIRVKRDTKRGQSLPPKSTWSTGGKNTCPGSSDKAQTVVRAGQGVAILWGQQRGRDL